MRQMIRGLIVAVAGFATSAMGADRPVTGPVPEWVQPAPAENIPGPATDAALQVLLSDQQVRFSTTTSEIYLDSRVRIQTPQGLQNIGTIALAWQPDVDVVTVHRLIVRRGAQVRDLLGNGQDFTILRREDLLEQATLTGTLTAVLQPPDLQVGDILEFAYTRRHADPVVPDKPDLQLMWLNAPVQSVRFRASWPKQMGIHWQLRDFKPQLQESSAGNNQSIAFTLENPPPLLQPTGAPMRFAAIRRVELSAFQSWSEVSRRFAPLYADAAKLAADSPLRAEIDRIRKASKDPKERAAAALLLTQEQIRYVLLAMNAGALVPATADQTWQRRYGDCKAKTVLLLALLRELGIDAEPVVVNTNMGDGIDQLLPAISAFDHVLVRATIAAKTYWLDGTRPGDRQLDRLQVPAFHWGLPLQARGSELVRIEPAPLAEPMLVQEVSLDASAGFDAPATFQAKAVFGGDVALGLKLSLDNTDATQRDQGLRNYWRRRFEGLQLTRVASSFDESTGTLTWSADGTLPLNWDDNDYYELDDMTLGFKPDFSRPEGSDAEAPYAISHPQYSVNRVRVKLPADMGKFTIYGDDINKTLVGLEYKRTARIENGLFTAEASSRSLVWEVLAKEARAAEAGLREMYKNGLYIQKPQQSVVKKAPTAAELRSQADKPLATAAEYLARAGQMSGVGLYALAVADYTRAIALDARLFAAYLGRGQTHKQLNHLDEARADFETARQLEPQNAAPLSALGALASEQNRHREAIELYSAALKLTDDKLTRGRRATSYQSLNELEPALADLEALARIDPTDTLNYMLRADLLKRLGRPEAVLALAEHALAARVGPDGGPMLANILYSMAGDSKKARGVFDEAIARTPTAVLYAQRGIFLTPTDPEGAAADLVQVLKMDRSTYDRTLSTLMTTAVKDKKQQEVLQILDRIEVASPGHFGTRLSRGQLLASIQQPDAAKEAFGSTREVARQANDFNNLCWEEAISGIGLEDALRDCDAALALAPRSSATLDSRGLVLLKLGRHAEAIANYDAAIAISPTQTSSLFGRGIAKLRLGRQSEGEADIVAAREISPTIERAFEAYGVKR